MNPTSAITLPFDREFVMRFVPKFKVGQTLAKGCPVFNRDSCCQLPHEAVVVAVVAYGTDPGNGEFGMFIRYTHSSAQ